jgi:MerR family transcriptional regulator/heat shock protein HspR
MEAPDNPKYHITVVAEMLEITPARILRYERRGLVRSHERSGERLYSDRALTRLRRVLTVTELGVNLPGAEVVCNLLERLEDLQQEREALREQVRRLLTDDRIDD